MAVAPVESWVCSWLEWYGMGKSPVGTLGVAASLHLQARGSGYAV